ncbi:hypothetical protein IQ63_32740 [Streptomyces acidiscabies]|uniref:Uncharacterized protein n=1 Tax=Streptomyces acidiscabies TaxID=42234 RepID=A0A0L0JSY2_9ACTN|nr:hypothetical protein IQ63_32740 [Streptomyces acidiscabies]
MRAARRPGGVLAYDPYVHDDLMHGYGVEPRPTLAAEAFDDAAICPGPHLVHLRTSAGPPSPRTRWQILATVL